MERAELETLVGEWVELTLSHDKIQVVFVEKVVRGKEPEYGYLAYRVDSHGNGPHEDYLYLDEIRAAKKLDEQTSEASVKSKS